MDTKANLSNRKKINELAVQHNKLTTLVACLLNEVGSLKKELSDIRGGNNDSNRLNQSQNYESHSGNVQNTRNNISNSKFAHFNELRAEEILKQLSVNNTDN
jgi:hypothetical protein